MNYKENTTKHSSDVTLKENKSSCYFQNPNKVILNKLKVDGGLISSQKHEKCDYIVHWRDNKKDEYVVYVELKGCDIKKALSQIMSTIITTNDKFSSYKFRKSVVVCSRFPKSDSTTHRLTLELKKKQNVTLEIKSRQCEVRVA